MLIPLLPLTFWAGLKRRWVNSITQFELFRLLEELCRAQSTLREAPCAGKWGGLYGQGHYLCPLPTLVGLPGKVHGQRNLVATVHGVAKDQTSE